MRGQTDRWVALGGMVATVCAAFGGALIGGKSANDGAQAAQERQIRYERARELHEARAVARLLVLELRGVRERVGAAGGAVCWSPGDYRIDLAPQDRRLLASQLPAETWGDVMRAYRLADRVTTQRRDGFSWRASEQSPDMELALEVLTNYDTYIGRVSSFAGIPDVKRSAESPAVERYRTVGRAPAGARTPARCRPA